MPVARSVLRTVIPGSLVGPCVDGILNTDLCSLSLDRVSGFRARELARRPGMTDTRISPMVIKKERDETFAAFPIGLVEACGERAVEIEHPQDDTALDQRDDEFGA